jgi:hypothetical protein
MKKEKFPFLDKDFKEGKIKIKKDKKPYLEYRGKISHFNIWRVDGEYIRKHISEDFVNVGQHYLFKFIPKKEFWISEGTSIQEEEFYLAYLIIENRLMAKGMSYIDASKIADKAEKKERNKDAIIRNLKHKKLKLAKKVHEELIKECGRIKIWLVNGEIVRDLACIDFAGGGHDKVYHFIPKEEIWIDDDIPEDERKFIILREMHERNLMAKKMNYRKAHRSATEIEDYCRRHPKKINEAIKQEIRKSDKSTN